MLRVRWKCYNCGEWNVGVLNNYLPHGTVLEEYEATKLKGGCLNCGKESLIKVDVSSFPLEEVEKC